jgi:hypothetical protein
MPPHCSWVALRHRRLTWTRCGAHSDVWCTYPVADRGPALMAYLRTAEAWAFEHVLVIETDYVFVAPLSIQLPAPVRCPTQLPTSFHREAKL